MALIVIDKKITKKDIKASREDYKPTIFDIKTDLRRAVMASFSLKKFADTNFITFFNNAQQNLELLKDKIGKEKYEEVMTRVIKSKDTRKPIEKRREDLLTASLLI